MAGARNAVRVCRGILRELKKADPEVRASEEVIFEGLDFYMISLSINVYMQRECVVSHLYPIGRSKGSSPVMANDGTLLDSHSYVYVLTILTTREPSVQPAKTLCRLLLPCRLFIWAEF